MYLPAFIYFAYLFLLVGVSLQRSYDLVQLGLSCLCSFQIYLVGFIHHFLLCFVFFFVIYISGSLILRAVFSVINICILFISCLFFVLTLGISLLLASKVIFNINFVVVEPGFILKAVYNYSLIGQYCLYFLRWQADYQSTLYFNLLESW